MKRIAFAVLLLCLTNHDCFRQSPPEDDHDDCISPVPQPSVQPASPSVTVGSYRGNNHVFT
ncbi:hypothetical protein [Sphingomonas sp.]|uniref:hypothetical protein n=1 Tax=Sphingomonas sp. TaxID=28214 RepID=UPI003B3B3FAE